MKKIMPIFICMLIVTGSTLGVFATTYTVTKTWSYATNREYAPTSGTFTASFENNAGDTSDQILTKAIFSLNASNVADIKK